MVPRGTYRACIHVSCVFVFLLFPASSAEKLGKTSLHCQVLHGHNQKSLVSPVWRRKCWIRNLECFCGRALSKCRNKSLAADPNPWSLFMEEGRDCSSTFVSLGGARPGREQAQHPVWSFWGCYCALLFCPPAGVTEGAARGTHSVMLGLWEGNLQFHGRMAQSWLSPEEMGRE